MESQEALSIEVDKAKIQKVMRIYGTQNERETVNQILDDIIYMEEMNAASEEEIASDIEKAIQAVRASRNKKKEYNSVTCSVCGKNSKVDVIIIKGTPYCGTCFDKIRPTIR
jgi:Arc/MetJ family transcription regulator